MLPLAFVALGVVALVVVSAALSQRRRAALLANIRRKWGRRQGDRARDMYAIAEYHRLRVASAGAHVSMDDRTWDDLNLDAVFQVLDRTESMLGQQALYHRLRTVPVGDNLDAFEALVTRMSADAPSRERAQMALARLQDPAGYDLWVLTQSEMLDVRAWHALCPVLAIGVVVTLLLVPLWPGALLIACAGAAMNLAVRIATGRRIGVVISAFRQLGPLIAAGEGLRFLQGDDIDPITRPLRVDLPRLGRLKTAASWVSQDPVAASDLRLVLFEYLNLFFLLDVNAVYVGSRALRACGPALLRVIAAAGDIDAALGVASYRAGTKGWTRPGFRPAATPITLSDVRHPLIAEAVPNSMPLGPPHGVLITGSNMSGKSTFIRTVGVTTVLAQTIHTCLTTGYEAPVMHVRSSIGRADDLMAGKSYYAVEVESVLALIRASADGTPHLLLFDELFRGTNAVERIAAAEAVLTELVVDGDRVKRHVVLAATHDGELVDLLRESYAAYHFTDSVGPDGLLFDYRLEPGPATTRNAIALLRLHGAPDALVTRAEARAAALTKGSGDGDHNRTRS